MNLEHGPKGLYVPKGNPTKLDLGRFRQPRVNRMGDTNNGNEESGQNDDNNFELDFGSMTAEEFDQYIDQIYAVRKGGGRENPGGGGKGDDKMYSMREVWTQTGRLS